MSLVQLYSAKNSCGFAALICLEEIGAEYSLNIIDIGRGEQKEANYLSINPRGLIPSMIAEGEIITELSGVLTYINSLRKDIELIPDRPLARAKVYEQLAWFSTSVHVAIAQIFRGERFSSNPLARETIAQCGRTRFAAGMDDFEKMASKNSVWLAGDTFTVIDAVSLVAWRWAERLEMNKADYPNWHAKVDAAYDRPAVRRALARESGHELEYKL